MKHLIVFLFLCLLALEAHAQQARFAYGTVIDKETKKPVALVTIGIVSKGIGTNSNEEGSFQLLIKEANEQDTVQFSAIGYETVWFIAKELLNKENRILLMAKTYALEQITIKAKKLTANNIIKGVIKNQKKNYNEKPFKLEAYYREIREVNGSYDHLIEVALNTYGKGIDKYHQKIELLNARKIDHTRFVHEENLLNSTLRLDYIANSEGIQLSDYKKNNYQFENILLEDNKNIYVISSGKFPERKYTFYIDEESLAIVRLEMEDPYEARQKLYIAPIDRLHYFRLRSFKVINRYKRYDGKYYPDYISVFWEYDKYNTVTKSIYEKSTWLREFRVNKIVTQDFLPPDLSKLMSKFGAKIDDQITAYDSSFWKNYNTIPLSSKEIKDLESKGGLEAQFVKNGLLAKKRTIFNCENEKTGKQKAICLLQNYQTMYDIPAGQIAVTKNNKLVISEAFGYSDLETKTKATTKTPFRIASISKTFAAVCALQLVENGRLNLDIPIQNYVTTFPQKKWEINARHLLNNTSGIRHYLDEEDFYRTTQYSSMTEAIEIFKHDTLLFEPNKSSLYSSFGFNLLGAVIEGASKTTYLNYLNTNILNPINMQSTYGEKKTTETKESTYYITKDNQKIKSRADNLSYKWSSGGLTSTAEDLTKFGIALLNSTILRKETFALFLKPQLIFDNATGYNLGWFIDTDTDGNLMLHHSGSAQAYSSHLLIYPAKNVVIAYLANTGSDTFFDKEFADEIVKMIEKE